jgi:hypothetical protein
LLRGSQRFKIRIYPSFLKFGRKILSLIHI